MTGTDRYGRTAARLAVLAILTMLSALCSTFAVSPAEMEGRLVVVIPWGNEWGHVLALPPEEPAIGDLGGPSAMTVDGLRRLLIYDPATRRLQRFAPDGKFQTGVWFGEDTPVLRFLVDRDVGGWGSGPVVADDSGYIALLESLGEVPAPARARQLTKAAFAPGTKVHGIVASGALLTVESGLGDRMPYIRHYRLQGQSDVRYQRRLCSVDVIAARDPHYYFALALDGRGTALYASLSAGALMVQRMDPGQSECVMPKEVLLSMPPVNGGGSRWHLLGSSTGGASQRFFYFSRTYPLDVGSRVYAVAEDGSVLGTAVVGMPTGSDCGKVLTHGRCLMAAGWHGEPYVGIPCEKGFAVVCYPNPLRPAMATR